MKTYKMNVLKKYLWTIWQCCAEESADGDTQDGILQAGVDFFVQGIMGNPQYQYKCLSDIDVSAARAEWESLGSAAQSNEQTAVWHLFNKHFGELKEAVKANDQVAFEAIAEKYC